MTNIGINTSVETVEIGKIYAYLWRGKLRIGEAIDNPDKNSGYVWAMKNVYTGKVEYPYQLDIIVPNTEFYEIVAKIDYDKG